MRWLVTIAVLTTAGAAHGDVERTPVLRWTLDDRLQVGVGTTPGDVLVGDRIVVAVDTTQRFAGAREAALLQPFFGVTTTGEIRLPAAMRDFYFASTGNAFLLDDGACGDGATPPASDKAIACVIDHERKADLVRWPRPAPVSTEAGVLPVWRCSADTLVRPGVRRPVRLLQRVGDSTTCEKAWTLVADPDADLEAVTVTLVQGTVRTELAATLGDGGWTVEAVLKEAGMVSLSVTVKRPGGVIETRRLEEFAVDEASDHSLVRVQPALLANQRLRAVNVGVAVTPVSDSFFRSGPWRGGVWLNGISPSAIVRFSGDGAALLQLGLGVSIFLNRSFVLNGGVLFGTEDPSRPWRLEPNVFVGVAVDPILLTEIRGAGK
jgi:hypothetical protein